MAVIIKIDTDEHDGYLVSLGNQESEGGAIWWSLVDERYDDVEDVLKETRYQTIENA